MLPNLREFRYPESLSEAVKDLSELAPRAAIIGGGTRMARWDDPRVEVAVDLSRAGLSYVEEAGDWIRIGSMTRIQGLVDSPILGSFAGGVLSRAAAAVPSRLVRNMSTLGGCVIPHAPSSALMPALLALEARVLIAGDVETMVTFDEFLRNPEWRRLGRTQILSEIRVQTRYRRWTSSYETFSRTETDPAWAIAVAMARLDGDTCAEARVTLGGVTARAVRVREIESDLAGEALPDETRCDALAEKAVAAARDDLTVDWRGSDEYRLHLVRVLTRRALWGATHPEGTQR